LEGWDCWTTGSQLEWGFLLKKKLKDIKNPRGLGDILPWVQAVDLNYYIIIIIIITKT